MAQIWQALSGVALSTRLRDESVLTSMETDCPSPQCPTTTGHNLWFSQGRDSIVGASSGKTSEAVDWHGSPNFPPKTEPYCGYGGDHLRCTEKVLKISNDVATVCKR
ncbi:hypothetical protein BV898_11208 [Hypsibius exemplaris]|uniref:Uncharacterized protein n=1 Tax=Hypsibius exemplaris TaxID=2072580 RepID=A0A1W0WHC6_HYPEX|nr:hypothetical protein BV898_11208 [Hypsibius exemplaris]